MDENDGAIKVVRNNSIGRYSWDLSTNITTLPWDSNKQINLSNRQNQDNTYCTTGASNGCNVWGNQYNTYIDNNTIDNEFNGVFKYKYYSNSTETDLKEFNNKGTVYNESSLNILLNRHWINEKINISNYIDDHLFYVGGVYGNVKSNDVKEQFIREKEEQNTYNWREKIGLINITDIVETSSNSSCTSVWSNFF